MGERVYGPYYDEKKALWRVFLARANGRRTASSFTSEAEAAQYRAILEKKAQARTVALTLAEYVEWMSARGRRARSLETTEVRLRGLCAPALALPLGSLTPRRAEQLYEQYAADRAPDTHRNALGQARTFAKWCVKRGYVSVNPWLDIEPIGQRSAGKPQLRIDDARALAEAAWNKAEQDQGARAVLLALLLGLRASEIVALTPADIDAGGRLLWIRTAKTNAGVRRLELPPLLGAVLTTMTGPRLFPYRRWWVREATHRLCRLAGVPLVTAHSLRGLHATLAVAAGRTSIDVAAALGHSSARVTERHYIAPGTSTALVAALFPQVSPGEKN